MVLEKVGGPRPKFFVRLREIVCPSTPNECFASCKGTYLRYDRGVTWSRFNSASRREAKRGQSTNQKGEMSRASQQ